jgi:hypothetical protein
MAPPPNLEAFNAPSREVCTVRRERTNTPLQALVTLNDPQFVEASRKLAERSLLAGKAGVPATIDQVSLRVLGRTMTVEEQGIVIVSLNDFLDHYRENTADAEALTSVGESDRDPTLDVAELAAWTMVCNEIMNLDEALNK